MANPAQLLLDQFRQWRLVPAQPSNVRVPSAQQIRKPESDGFEAHRVAVRHLEAIDRLLNEMSTAGANVAVYRRFFPAWCKAVFCYPNGWSGAAPQDIPDDILDHLETLAETLRYYVPVLQPDGLESVKDYAQQVKDALEKDDSIPEELRIHAHEVISHLLWCVDRYNLVGDFILAEAIERLAATIVRVASHSDEENKEKVWRSFFATTFVWPFAINVVAAIPAQALAMLALGPAQ